MARALLGRRHAGLDRLAARGHIDPQGVLIVFGGVLSATLINTALSQLYSALRSVVWVLFPAGLLSPAAAAEELSRLSRRARSEGGILALRSESDAFAGGFLKYALETIAPCGESNASRDILDIAIRRKRLQRQEDAIVREPRPLSSEQDQRRAIMP